MEEVALNEQPNGIEQFLLTLRHGRRWTFRGQRRLSGGSILGYEVRISIMERYDLLDMPNAENENVVVVLPMISVNIAYTPAPPGPFTQTLLDVWKNMQPSAFVVDDSDLSTAFLVSGITTLIAVSFMGELGLYCGVSGMFSTFMFASMRSVSYKIKRMGEVNCGIIITELMGSMEEKDNFIETHAIDKNKKIIFESSVHEAYKYNWFGNTIGMLRKEFGNTIGIFFFLSLLSCTNYYNLFLKCF